MNSHFFKRHRSYQGDGLLILYNFITFVKCWQHFQGLNRKGPYLSWGKENGNFCVVFTYSYSIKRAREIRKFHVAVMQRRLKNVQKSAVHVQSCCFENKNPLPFCRSRCRRLRRCLSCDVSSLLRMKSQGSGVENIQIFKATFLCHVIGSSPKRIVGRRSSRPRQASYPYDWNLLKRINT